MLKQKSLTQWQEAAQLKRLHDTQDSLKAAEDMCKGGYGLLQYPFIIIV